MIYTFELMSNHLHVAVKGSRDIVLEFFDLLKRMLIRYFTAQGINVHWNAFEGKTAPVTSLENLRNLLAYINRNGFVVHSEYSPFTYPWGANRFYFNPEIKRYHLDSGKTLSVASRRGISHSRKFDEGDGLFTVDGCVSPMSFCAVDHGERFFRNSSHYFAKVSRNVESYKDIASTIGESIFYTDDDLAAVAVGIAMKKYGSSQLSLLPQSAKIALAKELRCEYNSGAKQISRLLRIDVALVNKMFPRN